MKTTPETTMRKLFEEGSTVDHFELMRDYYKPGTLVMCDSQNFGFPHVRHGELGLVVRVASNDEYLALRLRARRGTLPASSPEGQVVVFWSKDSSIEYMSKFDLRVVCTPGGCTDEG